MSNKPKRKTKTSWQVKSRYREKVYARVYADLPKELVENFRIVIKEKGVSMASVLKDALERYLSEHCSGIHHSNETITTKN